MEYFTFSWEFFPAESNSEWAGRRGFFWYLWQWASTLALLIFALWRMTLSKVSFSKKNLTDFLDELGNFKQKKILHFWFLHFQKLHFQKCISRCPLPICSIKVLYQLNSSTICIFLYFKFFIHKILRSDLIWYVFDSVHLVFYV